MSETLSNCGAFSLTDPSVEPSSGDPRKHVVVRDLYRGREHVARFQEPWDDFTASCEKPLTQVDDGVFTGTDAAYGRLQDEARS